MGTTGTQASFMEIFNGDGDKIDRLNEILCEKAGFPSYYTVSTQTYTRKVDLIISQALAGFGATAQRIATDIRHLANLREMEEPFEYVYIPTPGRSRHFAAAVERARPLKARNRSGRPCP